MRARVLVCAMALALAACSTTVPPDEAFYGGAGQSYVVVATDTDLPPDGSETFTFQRVALASSTFLPRKFVSVGFSANAAYNGAGDEFQKPAPSIMRMRSEAGPPLRFGGAKAGPGDYALVSHSVRRHSGGYGYLNCYARGAGIYRFREGVINIVRLGKSRDISALLSGAASAVEVHDPAALQAQVTEVLAGYPKMSAPNVVAPLLGTATFEPQRNWLGSEGCVTPSAFSFTRGPGVSVDW